MRKIFLCVFIIYLHITLISKITELERGFSVVHYDGDYSFNLFFQL